MKPSASHATAAPMSLSGRSVYKLISTQKKIACAISLTWTIMNNPDYAMPFKWWSEINSRAVSSATVRLVRMATATGKRVVMGDGNYWKESFGI
jgi:hypothetical protein